MQWTSGLAFAGHYQNTLIETNRQAATGRQAAPAVCLFLMPPVVSAPRIVRTDLGKAVGDTKLFPTGGDREGDAYQELVFRN